MILWDKISCQWNRLAREDQARAERMDWWIAWEAEERVEARGVG